MRPFLAFEEPGHSFFIEELHIDNGHERIVLEGRLDISRDLEGYRKLMELKRVVDAAAAALKHRDTPEKIGMPMEYPQ